MVKNARKGWLFAGGLLLGVIGGAAGMMGLRGGDGPYTSSPPPATGVMGASASTAFVTAVAGNCDLAPVLPNGGDGDGHESLQAKPGAGSPEEVASLLLSGKEAAASGRQRDAEVDFLNACRNAAVLPGGDPIPLADSMYQLGRHYANVAALGAPKAKELFQRAERLYSASLEAYRARYGEGHEKTKFAQEGLVTVQQATGGKAPVAIAKAPPASPAPAPAPAPAAPAEAASAPATAAATPTLPAPAAPPKPAPVPEVAKAAPEREKAAPVVKDTPPDPVAKQAAPAPVAKAEPVRPARVRSEPEARSEPREDAAARTEAEEPRPRPQARRAPERETTVVEPADVADAPPLPSRRPRPAPMAEPQTAPAQSVPDTSSAGFGGGTGGAPQAEGSPNAQ